MELPNVLNTNIKTFWMLHRNIDRLNAENDLRQIQLILHGTAGGEGLEKMLQRLQDRVGTIMDIEGEKHHVPEVKEFDADAFESLRGLGSLG